MQLSCINIVNFTVETFLHCHANPRTTKSNIHSKRYADR